MVLIYFSSKIYDESLNGKIFVNSIVLEEVAQNLGTIYARV